MAFRGGMRRAFNEAGLWLAVAGAGAASFYYFEDIYRVLERQWPALQSSIASDQRGPGDVQAGGAAMFPGSVHGDAAAPHELRRSLTEVDAFIQKATQP